MKVLTINPKINRESSINRVQVTDANDSYIQPFREMPALNNMGSENANGISAHDLFSHYTADIIKEKIIFTR